MRGQALLATPVDVTAAPASKKARLEQAPTFSHLATPKSTSKTKKETALAVANAVESVPPVTSMQRPVRMASIRAAKAVKELAAWEGLPSSAVDSALSAARGGSSSAVRAINADGVRSASLAASAAVTDPVPTPTTRPFPELYTGAAPVRDVAAGVFRFADAPTFTPALSPEAVLRAGAFGGTYFRPIACTVTRRAYRDAWREFPAAWFKGVDVAKTVACPVYDPSVNRYGVACGQSLEAWQSSGWITSWDPYGWFQWYCRFFLGRRCEDDARQIGRWLACCGPTGRWKGNLAAKVLAARAAYDDARVAPVVRQTLLHWAYELTARDLAAAAVKAKATGVISGAYVPAQPYRA